MKWITYILLLLPFWCLSQQRGYDIKSLPACWKVSGKDDQSVTRVYLLNSDTTLLLSDYDSLGNAITISGGDLEIGYCGCNNPNNGLNSTIDRPNSLFAIKSEIVCWNTGSVDSTIVRYYLLNESGTLSVNDYNQTGGSVNISGGTLTTGYCECQQE